MAVLSPFSALLHKIWDSYLEYHQDAMLFKYPALALIGFFGFPLYYWIWTYLFPQPYENLLLRVIGATGCAFLFVSNHWPSSLKKRIPIYTYILLTYSLPFFFTFMLLMNGVNTVWLLSAVAALVYVILLSDSINAIIVVLLGTFLGFLTYFLCTGFSPIPAGYFINLPILVFLLGGMIVLKHTEVLTAVQKFKAANLLASHIAHEMRTPLLGINMSSAKINQLLPELLEAYEWAQKHGWQRASLSKMQQKKLPTATQRIREHVDFANLIIDMLLVSARTGQNTSKAFSKCSARACILKALESYHFKAEARDKISLQGEEDFFFLGSQVLMMHVIFNLIKNSLYAIAKKGQGNITIWLEKGKRKNTIHFKDTGAGIPAEAINYIFLPFYSKGKDGVGTGIGLSFCKRVIENFHGRIDCNSKEGIGTHFSIFLPTMYSDT